MYNRTVANVFARIWRFNFMKVFLTTVFFITSINAQAAYIFSQASSIEVTAPTESECNQQAQSLIENLSSKNLGIRTGCEGSNTQDSIGIYRAIVNISIRQ